MNSIKDDKILSVIEMHLEDGSTQEDIAALFGYSLTHFRHLFRVYYDTSLAEYMRRRRLLKAAEKIMDGAAIGEVAVRYGFDTTTGFSKAFKKEFGFAANDLKKMDYVKLDVVPNPVYNKDRIKISFITTKEIRLIGSSVIPADGNDTDLLEEVAYWLTHRFPWIDDNENRKINKYQDDCIAMWYHPVENMNIVYMFGPVVKDFQYVPDGMIPVSIPGGKYAVFETKSAVDRQNLASSVKELCKYIFWEWVPQNSITTDHMRFTFERYCNNKAYIYLPVIE